MKGDDYKIWKASFDFTDETHHEVTIGAKIIREGMAFMYQQLFDSNASTSHDIPYNLIPIIVEKFYPELAGDRKKLITLCYLSLFGLNPGELFFQLLDAAKMVPNHTGIDLRNDFLTHFRIKGLSGNEVDAIQYQDEMIDLFDEVLEKFTTCELEFLPLSFNAGRLSNRIGVPVIDILYTKTQGYNHELLRVLTDSLGIPYLIDNENHMFSSNTGRAHLHNDIVFMRLVSLVFETLQNPYSTACSAYLFECNGEVKSNCECVCEPWDGNKCAFTDAM